MSNSLRKFWMVRGNGMPMVEHANEETAIREAERLARLNHDQHFYVLEAVRCVVKSDVRHIDLTEWHAGQTQEIPF